MYAICFACGMDRTKDGCFFVCIFISVFIIFILKRINNQNVNHLHSFQQTDSQIDLHIIQTALNACEKQSGVRNQKKNNKDMEYKSKSKAKQSKSTIHFIKSPEIVFELISSSQRMFKRFFNENYLNYSAPTSFMSFPFYANICCAMRWNVEAACFF